MKGGQEKERWSWGHERRGSEGLKGRESGGGGGGGQGEAQGESSRKCWTG